MASSSVGSRLPMPQSLQPSAEAKSAPSNSSTTAAEVSTATSSPSASSTPGVTGPRASAVQHSGELGNALLKLQSSQGVQAASAAIYASVRASQDAKDSSTSNDDSQQVKQPANYTALSFHGATAAYNEAANGFPD